MKILFDGNVTKIAQIEAILLITGKLVKDNKPIAKVIPVDQKFNTATWAEQREFRSPIFTKRYLLTLDNKIRYLCKWFEVKFFYDLRLDYANIQVSSENEKKLRFLVEEQGFNLLQQERPEDAERIKNLMPKGFDSLEKHEVENNGKGKRETEREPTTAEEW